jgi:hypothetical protein
MPDGRCEVKGVSMNKLVGWALLGFGALFLTACGTTNRREITNITLENAMRDVGKGLNAIYEERADKEKLGLLPSEIAVTFNVAGKGTDSSKLYIEAGADLGSVSIAKAGAELGRTLEISRGNTITIKFTSVLYAGKDTLVQLKTPQEISKLLELLSGQMLLNMR